MRANQWSGPREVPIHTRSSLWRMALVLLCTWWAAGLLGCEARISLGGRCTRDLECSGLLCLYGRCRAECTDRAQCADGLDCNSGVCAQPTEACSEANPCERPDEACAGTICASRCTAAGTCAGESVCQDRIGGSVCVPAARGDAGAPAPLDASGLDAFDLDAAAPDASGPDAVTYDSSTHDASLPASRVRDFCLGPYHACLARTDGTVACWGVGNAGELGGGTPLVDRQPGTVPCTPNNNACTCSTELVEVVDADGGPLRDVVALYCGARVTLARTSTGLLHSWGFASSGQLGRPFDGSAPTGGEAFAAPVTDAAGEPLTGVLGAAFGLQHGCAWLADGTTRCWGAHYGPPGALGTGEDPPITHGSLPATALATAFAMSGSGPTRAAAMTNSGTCVIGDDAHVFCFGANNGAAMGVSEAFTHVVRVPNRLSIPASTLAAGSNFVCALGDGTPNCWGYAGEGALGRGDVSGYASRCPASGELCDPAPAPMSGPVRFTQLASDASSSTVCGVTTDGNVRCWGSGRSGANGAAARAYVLGPVIEDVDGNALADIRLLRVSESTACALSFDDTLRCWGANGAGLHRTTPDPWVGPDHPAHARAVVVPLD